MALRCVSLPGGIFMNEFIAVSFFVVLRLVLRPAGKSLSGCLISILGYKFEPSTNFRSFVVKFFCSFGLKLRKDLTTIEKKLSVGHHTFVVQNYYDFQTPSKKLKELYARCARESPSSLSSKRRKQRHIHQHPERILDAPDIMNDYYLNPLDWSQSNVLAVALGYQVFLWNAASGQ